MTSEEKAAINTQNAQHSTGPKTEEGKAIASQNAVTHGLTSAIPPLENPQFLQILNGFLRERNPQTPTQHLWVEELAHVAWKLKQIPFLEQEAESNSGLTVAQHFAQEKPTPLTRLWNLQLRLQGRFNSIERKLSQNGCPVTHSDVDVHVDAPPSAPKNPVVQNEPDTQMIDEMIMNAMKSILQNEPAKIAKTRNKLAAAVHSVPINIPNPF